MADKVNTVERLHLGQRLGRVTADEMAQIEVAVMAFLGLAG
jgi:mRNA-degrading endonuclease toxin of MazEF toxin-antitoxin module